MSCYFCGAILPDDLRIYRNTLCSSCGRPLKICRNCRFYDPDAPYACTEHISEAVKDKESANFCDYFQPGDHAAGKDPEEHRKALDNFNSLFSDD